MKRTSEQDQIALQGLDLDEGQFKRGSCPHCGSSQSFRLSRYDNILFYKCYRASCPTSGLIPLSPGAIYKSHPVKENQEFRQKLYALPDKAREYVQTKYGISDIHRYAKWSEAYGLIFPVLDKFGSTIGYTSKNLYGKMPKAHTWRLAPDVPLLYQPRASWDDLLTDNLILVEGCLDAIKVTQAGYRAIALIGSNLSVDQAKSLKAQGYTKIGLMLDADTWHHAKPGKLRDQFGLYFDKFTLIPTDADPKDTHMKELRRNIDGWINRKATACNDL